MIMKLHTPAPYESRMCLIVFGVKRFGLFEIENSQECSMFIQRVFATRLFESLMHPLLVPHLNKINDLPHHCDTFAKSEF